MKYTRQDILNKMMGNINIQELDLSLYKTKIIMDTFIQELGNMISNCKEADSIEIRGLGTFRVVLRTLGVKRNPKTGEIINCDPYLKCRFKEGKYIKIALRDKENEKN